MMVLKPCPFCGNKAKKKSSRFIDDDGCEWNTTVVQCGSPSKCMMAPKFEHHDGKYAVTVWNKRKK